MSGLRAVSWVHRVAALDGLADEPGDDDGARLLVGGGELVDRLERGVVEEGVAWVAWRMGRWPANPALWCLHGWSITHGPLGV